MPVQRGSQLLNEVSPFKARFSDQHSSVLLIVCRINTKKHKLYYSSVQNTKIILQYIAYFEDLIYIRI